MLNNALKYALRGKDTGKPVISVEKIDSKVTLSVEDNGNGLPESFDASQSEGFGLTLVRMISQQLKRSFSLECDSGTWFRVTFDA